MPKIATACINCGQIFYRYPAFHREAERRGTSVKFCSRSCTDAARSKELIGTKKRRGETLKCEVCDMQFYRRLSRIKNGKSRFCSEPCRIRAHQLRLIDRSGPRPQNLRGQTICCMFCGKEIYRKLSMLVRNIGKTCGSTACVSAYGRYLWGLSPRDPETVALPRSQRKYRATNFTASQRTKWIDDKCAFCGTTDNLTLDHTVAVCCGGTSTQDNAQTLCGACNNWKAKYVDRPLARQQTLSGGCQS